MKEKYRNEGRRFRCAERKIFHSKRIFPGYFESYFRFIPVRFAIINSHATKRGVIRNENKRYKKVYNRTEVLKILFKLFY